MKPDPKDHKYGFDSKDQMYNACTCTILHTGCCFSQLSSTCFVLTLHEYVHTGYCFSQLSPPSCIYTPLTCTCSLLFQSAESHRSCLLSMNMYIQTNVSFSRVPSLSPSVLCLHSKEHEHTDVSVS